MFRPFHDFGSRALCPNANSNCAIAEKYTDKQKNHIYLIPYVSNKKLFDSLQLASNKIFLNKLLIRFHSLILDFVYAHRAG